MGLSHALSLQVTAEGVEIPTELDEIIELGADCAQGFLLSRPLASNQLGTYLQRQDPILLSRWALTAD